MSADSLVGYLLKHNVTVGVGPRGVGPIGHPFSAEMTNSRARNLRFDVGEVRELSIHARFHSFIDVRVTFQPNDDG